LLNVYVHTCGNPDSSCNFPPPLFISLCIQLFFAFIFISAVAAKATPELEEEGEEEEEKREREREKEGRIFERGRGREETRSFDDSIYSYDQQKVNTMILHNFS
jgi:hypothetical protein